MPGIIYRNKPLRFMALLAYFGIPAFMFVTAAKGGDLKSGELWLAGGWLLVWLMLEQVPDLQLLTPEKSIGPAISGPLTVEH